MVYQIPIKTLTREFTLSTGEFKKGFTPSGQGFFARASRQADDIHLSLSVGATETKFQLADGQEISRAFNVPLEEETLVARVSRDGQIVKFVFE
jgi:hypothetical protein